MSQRLAHIGLKPAQPDLGRSSNFRLSIDGTGEVVEARPWRNRTEILEVMELTRGPNSLRLLNDLSRWFADQGGQLLLLYRRLFSSYAAMFRNAGFALLEEVIELASVSSRCIDYQPNLAISLRRERDPARLLDIDRKAFPWLWRNSRDEMPEYLRQAEVRALAATANGGLVGYVTYTMHRDFAHIDRMAVLPEQQGRGIGKALMRSSLEDIREAGRENVILTTQRANIRSQNLYRKFGFTETRRGYSIYGKWL